MWKFDFQVLHKHVCSLTFSPSYTETFSLLGTLQGCLIFGKESWRISNVFIVHKISKGSLLTAPTLYLFLHSFINTMMHMWNIWLMQQSS